MATSPAVERYQSDAIDECVRVNAREKVNDVQNRTWDVVMNGMYYREREDASCSMSFCGILTGKDLKESLKLAEDAVNVGLKEDEMWNLTGMQLQQVYVRLNRVTGKEFKFNGFVRRPESELEWEDKVPVTVWLSRGFGAGSCTVHLDDSRTTPEQKPIYVIVPYSGRQKQLGRFLENFITLKEAKVNLKVLLAATGSDSEVEMVRTVVQETLSSTKSDIDKEDVTVFTPGTDKNGKFSRAVSLRDTVARIPNDALMAFIDIDLLVQRNFFSSCFYNTRQGHLVYFPIMYSLYPYGKRVAKEHGYWRTGSFGMMCGYKSDFVAVSAYSTAEEDFSGWGWEDVSLYQKFQQSASIEVFRAIEPALLHRWHPKHCDFNRFVSPCIGTIYNSLGSPRFLANIIVSENIDVTNVEYIPEGDTAQRKEASAAPLNAKSSFKTTSGKAVSYIEAKAKYEESLENSGLLAKFAADAKAQGDSDI